MSEPVLVILAAGLGSRYGGNKQTDGVGPNGEILMHYSIYDAVQAGFSKIVLLIKENIYGLVKNLCGDEVSKLTTPDGRKVEIVYAYQEYSSIPKFYKIPAERTKPFGTVHALLCTRSAIDAPFVVINADDYYGPEAYKAAYASLSALKPSGEAMMILYRLKNTLSPLGAVNRGVCRVTDGYLSQVDETYDITLGEDGVIRDANGSDGCAVLDPLSGVSMNIWGFMPSIFDDMEQYFDDFMRNIPENDIKSECLLPIMVDSFIKDGKLTVQALETDAEWFGVTYLQEKEYVKKKLLALHEAGVYPEAL